MFFYLIDIRHVRIHHRRIRHLLVRIMKLVRLLVRINHRTIRLAGKLLVDESARIWITSRWKTGSHIRKMSLKLPRFFVSITYRPLVEVHLRCSSGVGPNLVHLVVEALIEIRVHLGVHLLVSFSWFEFRKLNKKWKMIQISRFRMVQNVSNTSMHVRTFS